MHSSLEICSDTTIRPASFDGLLARRVEAVLAEARAGARFLIDLSQVREIHDFALAVLAQALTRTTAHVTVRGLRYPQFAMLQRFGVDTQRLEGALVPAAA